MKLEQQVCSLELAKKLKELGTKQESLYYHYATEIEEDGLAWWDILGKEPRKGKRVREYLDSVLRCSSCSAFTVAELGEMLPHDTVSYKLFTEPWGCEFNLTKIHADTEADVRAKMLIYLLDKKLISLADAR